MFNVDPEYKKRIDQLIESWGIAWAHPIDESAGLRWDSYNARWMIKLAGRTDKNAWILEAGLDYALAWAIKAMRDGELRAFLAKVDAPQHAIYELIDIAALFHRAECEAKA